VQISSTTVSVEPATITIEGCETVEVEVWINDVDDLYGAEVKVSFDADMLEVVDSNEFAAGVQVANGGLLTEPVFAAVNDADNTSGEIHYAATQLNPTPPVSGSGAFVVIHFRAKQAGTSPLAITFVRLADRDAIEIPSSGSTGGSVTANAPAAPPLSIAMFNPSTARLSWIGGTGVDSVALYRDPAPYFTPSPPPYQSISLPTLNYDDVGALGDPGTNHYYVLSSVCATDFESPSSNRVGEFDYAPGSRLAVTRLHR
jgi:hypothetical protein